MTGDGGCTCGYRAGSRPTQIGCGGGRCPFAPTPEELQAFHDLRDAMAEAGRRADPPREA